MFKEGVEIIRRMWIDSPADFAGVHYRVESVFCEPRPDPRPTLMLDGGDEKRTLEIIAEYAD